MSNRVLTALVLAVVCGVVGCDRGAPSDTGADAKISPAGGGGGGGDATANAHDHDHDDHDHDHDHTDHSPFASPDAILDQGLVFESYEHDFGRILDTEKVTAVFKFRNTSDQVVKIGKPQASCGCTVPQLEKNEYSPDERGSIEVTFSPKGVGRTTKDITIPLEGLAPVRLAVSANVVPILSVEPRGVSFVNVKRGSEMSVPVMVRSRDPKVEIVSVTAMDGRVNIVVDDRGSATDNADLPGVAGFRVVLPADTPVGMVTDKLILKVKAAATEDDEQKEQTIQLNVSGRVKGDLFTQPQSLNIPALGPGLAFESAVLVRSADNSAFEIEGVEIRDANFEGVTADWDIYEFAGERSYRVTVRGEMPETVGKMLTGVLVVKTNVPGEETLRVVFRGRVQPKGGPTPVGGPRPRR